LAESAVAATTTVKKGNIGVANKSKGDKNIPDIYTYIYRV